MSARGAWLLALMLSTSLLCGAEQKRQTASAKSEQPSKVELAEKKMDAAEWAEAEALLRAAVKENAREARAWFDLGWVMHAQKNYAESIAAYRSAVEISPKCFECNLNLGTVLAHEKQSEAERFIEGATRLEPGSEHPELAKSRAWALLAQLREKQAAVEAWKHAVLLAPENVPYRSELGVALERVGEVAEAERELQRAMEMDAKAPEAPMALANLYLRTHRLPEAEAALRQVIARDDGNENAHLQLGRVLSAEKKFVESIAELQKALALRPEDAEALRDLAFAEEKTKRWAEAEAHYRQLTALAPEDAELHNGLGYVLLSQLKYAEAKGEFETSVRLRPQWSEAWGQLALAASGNKEFATAIHALDERGKRLPELPSTYFLRATCYDHLRQFASAVENYKAFLAASNGQYPDDEWKARHRLIAIEPEARRQK